MIFNFDAVRIGHPEKGWIGWKLPDLKAIYAEQNAKLGVHDWNTIFLSNHDNPRVVSAFGNDSEEFRVASAKLLATMLLTLKGTPFIYEGDELGMTNYPFKGIGDFDDIEVKNAWKELVEIGKIGAEHFLAQARKVARDNSRTPMQWDTTANAGFTSGPKTWLAVNPNYKQINAAAEVKDPDSTYHYFRRMLEFRGKTKAFAYGTYEDLDPKNEKVFAYTRTLGKEKYLVVLNFSSEETAYGLPGGMKAGKLQVSNLGQAEEGTNALKLRPWEARVYRQ